MQESLCWFADLSSLRMRIGAVPLGTRKVPTVVKPQTITRVPRAPRTRIYAPAAAGTGARPTARTRGSGGMAVAWVPEDAVRKAVAAAAKVCLLSPRESWSADFLIEFIISELLALSSQGATPVAATTSSNNEADMPADRAQAAAGAPAGSSDPLMPLTSTAVAALVGKTTTAGTDTHIDLKPKGAAAAGAAAAAATSQLPDIILEYYEAEPSDITDLQQDLDRRLQQLMSEHAAAGTHSEEELGQGACRLCGRTMPLTKHHLVPKEVHKEFRKRGWSREQLAEGVGVCRPCHSAIHKAVPDNKELGTQYSSLEALQQHERISKFAAWAAKQRTPSAADVRHNPNFRYQR